MLLQVPYCIVVGVVDDVLKGRQMSSMLHMLLRVPHQYLSLSGVRHWQEVALKLGVSSWNKGKSTPAGPGATRNRIGQ